MRTPDRILSTEKKLACFRILIFILYFKFFYFKNSLVIVNLYRGLKLTVLVSSKSESDVHFLKITEK